MSYEELKETLFDGRPVVLKCGTEWCQPCKVMDKPLMATKKNEHYAIERY